MATETMTTPWVGLPHPDWPHLEEAPQEEAPTWDDYGAISDAIDRGDPAGFEALMALYHSDIINPTCLRDPLPDTHGCVLDPERPLAFTFPTEPEGSLRDLHLTGAGSLHIRYGGR